MTGGLLHHVVALELAVHEVIQPDLLLYAYALGDLLFRERDIVLLGHLALTPARARGFDFRRLREGAYGRGGQERQPETLFLDLFAGVEVGLPHEIVLGQRRNACADGGIFAAAGRGEQSGARLVLLGLLG